MIESAAGIETVRSPSTSGRRFVDRVNRLGYMLMVVVVILSLVLGILSALIGETFSQVGSGPGGLFGLPMIVLIAPVLFGIPALFVGIMGVIRGRANEGAYLIAVAGPVLLWLTHSILSHGLDLCNWGVWDMSNRFDGTAMCEGPLDALGINTRFHLLMHSAPTSVVLFLYSLLLRRSLPQTFGGP